jgi:hypothetical protein
MRNAPTLTFALTPPWAKDPIASFRTIGCSEKREVLAHNNTTSGVSSSARRQRSRSTAWSAEQNYEMLRHGFSAAVCALMLFLIPSEAKQSNTIRTVTVPPGTILSVRLNTSLSSEKSKPGEVITGRIMQQVPLPGAAKISPGSKVFGRVLAVTPGNHGGSEISIRFDSVAFRHQRAALLTTLRAIAGFVAVEQARVPIMSSGEGEVYDWLLTVQIGGEDVYGVGGPVTRWNDPSEVVGKETPDGLLGQVHARGGTSCSGPLHGNDSPQAFWVFSSDACGAYGLANLIIAHAGRTNPAGAIVLRSSNGKLSLPSGTGMLLRVREADAH